MHCDIHRQLHAYRATELRTAAGPRRDEAAIRTPRADIRTRVGWTMVEVGLRLAQSRPHPSAGRAPRTA